MIYVIWCHRIDKFDWVNYPPYRPSLVKGKTQESYCKWDVSTSNFLQLS